MYQKEKFASRLRMLRKNKGEAQVVLAELLGISGNQISEMELGKKTTTFEKLTILCEHYNVSADYLLGLSDTPRKLR